MHEAPGGDCSLSQQGPHFHQIRVKTATADYRVCIGSRISSKLSDYLASFERNPNGVLFVDQNVAKLHAERIAALQQNRSFLIPPGEASKSLETAAVLYQQLANWRVERNDVIVAIGGGVVTDLAGFVAATWLRGVRYISMPTTIEAAIDASVGGKTGINHTVGKNLIGAFHHPSAVMIDTDFFSTLTARDLVAGLAESAKHALLASPAFVEWHETHLEMINDRDPGTLAELIARNVEIKADIVARDERESGLRAILNYGHTIGHAIEHLLGYELRHGECVALGIIAENELAVSAGIMQAETAKRIRHLLGSLGLPRRLPRPLDPAAVFDACRVDKKVRRGKIHFALLRDVGDPIVVDNLTDEQIANAVQVLN